MNGKPRAGRPALVAALCALAVHAGGCARDPERPAAPAAEEALRVPSGDAALLPVALPDLSRIEEPVQAQLREQHALIRKKDAGSAPALERGDAYGGMGKLLMAAKHYDLADAYLLNAHTLAPRDHRWPYYLGHLYLTKGEMTRAASFFQRAVEQRPDDEAALVWSGEVHLDEGRPAAAAPLFAKALAAQPRSLAARVGLGRAALAQQDYRGAVGHFEAALALNPQAAIVHYPLALAYRGLGDTARAEAHLRQRGDFDVLPTDPLMEELRELLHSAISYEIRGTRALNSSDWETALAQFRAGLTLEPSNPTLRHKLATALYQLGEVREAQQAFEEVIRRAPAYARAHYSLGILLETDGRDQQALERFSAAVAHDPGYLEARVRLAGLLRRSGRFGEALTHFERALAIDPRLAEAAFGHAMTLVGLRRYQDARERLREGARAHPAEPIFAHALVRILAAAPDDRVRDGREALAVMKALSADAQRLDLGESMAIALAEMGRYEEAAGWQRAAIASARQAGHADLAQRMTGNLRLYEAGRPCRTPWRDDDLP